LAVPNCFVGEVGGRGGESRPKFSEKSGEGELSPGWGWAMAFQSIPVMWRWLRPSGDGPKALMDRRRLRHAWPRKSEHERKKIKVVAWSPFYSTRRGRNGEERRGGGGSSTATTCRTEEGRGSGAALGCSADSGTTVAGTGGACYAPGVTIATTVFKQYLIM
jgi:hypothetical protein